MFVKCGQFSRLHWWPWSVPIRLTGSQPPVWECRWWWPSSLYHPLYIYFLISLSNKLAIFPPTSPTISLSSKMAAFHPIRPTKSLSNKVAIFPLANGKLPGPPHVLIIHFLLWHFLYMGRINQERKNDPLGSLYSELWQLISIWRKHSNVSANSAIVQNCGAILASPSNLKNNFGNIFKFFFENFQKNFWKCSQIYFLYCFDSRKSRGNSVQLLKFS